MIRIVVVDDHAVVRSGLRLLLEAESDMEVVGEAGNARDAIFEVRAAKPRSRPTNAFGVFAHLLDVRSECCGILLVLLVSQFLLEPVV